MTAANIREARQSDKQELQSIWKTIFGDSDEEVDSFFKHYFSPRLTIVADCADGIKAAGYLLPVGNLACGKFITPCAMIYAVATHPEYRSRGFGAAVVNELISKGYDNGYEAIVLHPSADSLFEYYSSHTEMLDWFYVNEYNFKPPPGHIAGINLTPATVDEYGQLREHLLADVPHIAFDDNALSYQSQLCDYSGGGLYMAEFNGGAACAIIEKQPGKDVLITELLTSNFNETDVLSSVASIFPAAGYFVRRPAAMSDYGSGMLRFGMLAISADVAESANSEFRIPNSKLLGTSLPYYGLAFD